MRSTFQILALAAIVLSLPVARIQAQTIYDTATFVSRVDASLGYQYIRSNAPPNSQPTFHAQGGFGEVHASVWRYMGVAGEVTGTQASNISALGQDLTLLTYAAGPRATLQGNRFSLYAQALFGRAHGSDSYFPTETGYTTSAGSLAYSGGGGVDYYLSHRWAIRGEVQFLHTAFPNGVNGSQQHLMVGAGLVYRIGGRYSHPRGQQARSLPVEPAIQPMPEPSSRQSEQLQTPAPASNTVMVIRPIVPVPQAPSEDHSSAPFRANVKNVYFDIGDYGLRTDALSALAHAATYLREHPEERVVIGGVLGSADHEFDTLTQRRISAIDKALIAGGVTSDRITVVPATASACTDSNEICNEQRNVITLTEQR